MDNNSNEGRYQKILQDNYDVMNLMDNIEKSQNRRRAKARVKWWWNKLTFRGYKNDCKKK